MEVRVARKGATSAEDVAAPDEVGELIARGPSIMKEYFRQPERTQAALRDGWYYSGDVAFADEEGFVTGGDPAEGVKKLAAAARAVGAAAGAGKIKSNLSGARRALRKKTPDREKALKKLGQALKSTARSWPGVNPPRPICCPV
jgi:acyl-CoA synthetase (AMP-forming)/AMP-acid ligase II